MNDFVKGVAAYKTIDYFVTSADARLAYRAQAENLDYLKERDSELKSLQNLNQTYETERHSQELDFQKDLYRRRLQFEEDQAEIDREHEDLLQLRAMYMHGLELEAYTRQADLDRQARLVMQAIELNYIEKLETRRLRVEKQIMTQKETLQKYLFEQGVKSSQELERFKAIAMRETQILLARENAQNKLKDRIVKEALRTFPLNISPVVILKNQPQSLSQLLRFSSILNESSLPSIIQVYNDVKEYSKNPEPLNIFIAPIYIDSKIKNRETLSQQVWDTVYQKVESFFIHNYNRRGDHPVVLYPTAWKESAMAGQHASETLYFFLKDLPCLVIEPRFDGNTFSLMLSSWGLGYATSDHIRTEMNFEINLDLLLVRAAFERSVTSLKVLDKLGGSLSPELSAKKKKLEQNIKYFNLLGLADKKEDIASSEINAMGAQTLFEIDPSQDMAGVSILISSLICLNLAILADVHHLQGTEAPPLFPKKFKEYFPDLFVNEELRQIVADCYKKIYLYLRNEETLNLDSEFKIELEKVREMQILNLNKQLELIDENELNISAEEKLVKYANEKFNLQSSNTDEIWNKITHFITAEDIPFFKELFPHITNRRLKKRLEKKLSELQLNLR